MLAFAKGGKARQAPRGYSTFAPEALTMAPGACPFEAAKSPLGTMLVMLSGAVPEFVRVTVCAALVLPTF